MKLISKRIIPIIWDNPMNTGGSLRITITSELLDLGIDPMKEKNLDLEKQIAVSLIEENGKKKIVIERVEK